MDDLKVDHKQLIYLFIFYLVIQITGIETSFEEIYDVFENNGAKGLCEDSISKLPKCMFNQGRNYVRAGEGRGPPKNLHVALLKKQEIMQLIPI